MYYVECILQSIKQYMKTIPGKINAYSVYLFIIISIVYIAFRLLSGMIVDKHFKKMMFENSAAILPLIIPCIDIIWPDSSFEWIVVLVVLLQIIVIISCNTRFYREQKKNSAILAIHNANSRKRSESTIDSAVEKVGDYLFCREYYICDSVFSELRQDAFRAEINQLVDQMINYISDAYGKSEDRIGVNIWVRKKMWNPYNKPSKDGIDNSQVKQNAAIEPNDNGETVKRRRRNAGIRKNAGIQGYDSQSAWYVVYRRNTNEDPPIARIVDETGTTFGEVKDYPGKIVFMDKEKAKKEKLYLELPEKTGTQERKRKIKGSIFCQNISISLDNCDKVIGIVVSVTSYNESLCKKTEKEEIQRALECFGLEIKSIVAKYLLSHPYAKKRSHRIKPPCGKETLIPCSEESSDHGTELCCCMYENDVDLPASNSLEE